MAGPSNLNQQEGFSSGIDPSGANWNLNDPILGKTYTVTVTISLPDLGHSYVYKPSIALQLSQTGSGPSGCHTTSANSPDACVGPKSSVTVPDPSLNGATAGAGQVTLSVDQSVTWDLGGPGTVTEVRYTGLQVPPDATPPSVTAPVASLAVGATLGSTTSPVPVILGWSGADAGSGLDYYQLALSKNGGAYALVASPTTTRYVRSFPSSTTTTYRFRVRAFDKTGNHSAWAYGSTFHVRLVQESSAALHWAGSWSTGTSASASGGHYRSTTHSGASVSYTFTGRNVAVVGYEAANLGSVKVYINGVYKGTVSEHATSTLWRRVLCSTRWSSSATRTIKLVWAGTTSHPGIDLDAFVVLQ
ncbi:MAG: hypothetical protein ACYDCI_05255 [Candidatus Limnocylindrales bacterium]